MEKRHSTVLQNAWNPKKSNTLIEKTIPALKPYKFIWKNGTAPSYKMPETQKNKHSHWKNISGLKNPINSYEKTAQHRLTKCLTPKKSNTLIEKTIPALKTL